MNCGLFNEIARQPQLMLFTKTLATQWYPAIIPTSHPGRACWRIVDVENVLLCAADTGCTWIGQSARPRATSQKKYDSETFGPCEFGDRRHATPAARCKKNPLRIHRRWETCS